MVIRGKGNGLQLLVQPLCLAIGLGMEARREADHDPQEVTKVCPELSGELGPSV